MKNDNHNNKIFEEFCKYIGINHAENTAKEFDDIFKKSKDLDFPKKLDEWFDEYNNDIRKREKRNKFKIDSIIKKIAIFLIILALGAFITTMSVEAYRIRFFNIITEIKDKYTDIDIEREVEHSKENDILKGEYFYPSHIPEGYKQSDIKANENLSLIYFKNKNEEVIEFLQTDLDPNFQVDTEDADTEEISVNNSKGLLVIKDDIKTLLWFTESNTFYITGKLNEKEIILMAENIELIK